MTEAFALFAVLAVAVLIAQLWLLVDGLRLAVTNYVWELLQFRTWQARDKKAIAARKALEAARWQDESGRAFAFDFDTEQVRELRPDVPAVTVPNGRQWQVALIKAVGWGQVIGWTERAWRENTVVYLPETGEHYETGRRQIISELDALGITAGGALGRTWAAGMSYQAALDLLDSTPPAPKWAESPPPSVRLPREGANPRSYEHGKG